MKSKWAGRVLLLRAEGCVANLNDAECLRGILQSAAIQAGATLLGKEVTHKFNPQGLSIVYLLAESHIAIHTVPEDNYAEVTIHTCGSRANPANAVQFLVSALGAANYEALWLQDNPPG